MLNYIWAGMIILSVLYGMATGRMEQVGNGAIESTKEAVSMCITMLGIMSMWMGFMEVAQKSGLIAKAEKMLEENSVPFKELIDLVVKEIVVNRDNIQIYMCFDKKFIQER